MTDQLTPDVRERLAALARSLELLEAVAKRQVVRVTEAIFDGIKLVDGEYELYDFLAYEAHEQQWLDHLMKVSLPRFKQAVRDELFREASLRWFARSA